MKDERLLIPGWVEALKPLSIRGLQEGLYRDDEISVETPLDNLITKDKLCPTEAGRKLFNHLRECVANDPQKLFTVRNALLHTIGKLKQYREQIPHHNLDNYPIVQDLRTWLSQYSLDSRYPGIPEITGTQENYFSILQY